MFYPGLSPKIVASSIPDLEMFRAVARKNHLPFTIGQDPYDMECELERLRSTCSDQSEINTMMRLISRARDEPEMMPSTPQSSVSDFQSLLNRQSIGSSSGSNLPPPPALTSLGNRVTRHIPGMGCLFSLLLKPNASPQVNSIR